MINRYIILAIVSILIVVILYFINFYIVLNYKVSESVSDWANFGDYIGGVLGPILSFISMVLLIKSLNLQNEANINLMKDVKNNEKTEKLRSFETLFFNLISSQKDIFNSFKIEIPYQGDVIFLSGSKGVIKIESIIEDLRSRSYDDKQIATLIEDFDVDDKIYSVLRAFYITVKTIETKLSDENDFSLSDRESYYHALVNFTDFSQIRLILMSIQFMECEPSLYFIKNIEFKNVMEELNLGYDLY